VVTESSVRRAIETFGPLKAAGPDEIFPALLQKSLEVITPYLVEIFRGCLVLGYTPILWRTSKVIYLPKPGKDSYEKASSWRPITLMPFLLKTLERLIDWHIRTPTLINSIKSAGQCAYMIGTSTESALHRVISRMEKTFNNTSFDSINKALKKHGIDDMSRRWIASMLINRKVYSTIDDTTRCRSVERGCPQRGVLSPLFWILVVNELLLELKSKHSSTNVSGFADNISVYATGIDLGTVSAEIQNVIKTAVKWSKSVGLSIDQKANLMLVTKKKKKMPKTDT